MSQSKLLHTTNAALREEYIDLEAFILKRKYVKFFSTLILMCRPLIFLFVFKEVMSFLRMRQG